MQVSVRAVYFSVEIWTGTSDVEVLSFKNSVSFLDMYYMVCSIPVWQMFGNENISQRVPAFYSRYWHWDVWKVVEQYRVLKQQNCRVEQVAMMDWTYAKYTTVSV